MTPYLILVLIKGHERSELMVLQIANLYQYEGTPVGFYAIYKSKGYTIVEPCPQK